MSLMNKWTWWDSQWLQAYIFYRMCLHVKGYSFVVISISALTLSYIAINTFLMMFCIFYNKMFKMCHARMWFPKIQLPRKKILNFLAGILIHTHIRNKKITIRRIKIEWKRFSCTYLSKVSAATAAYSHLISRSNNFQLFLHQYCYFH